MEQGHKMEKTTGVDTEQKKSNTTEHAPKKTSIDKQHPKPSQFPPLTKEKKKYFKS